MMFLGEIKKTPCIDYFAYHKSIREGRNRLMLISDFEIEGCFDVYAIVYGKFDDSFCSGANPLKISENGKEEVKANIQISNDLVARLESDGETSTESIMVLKKELGHES